MPLVDSTASASASTSARHSGWASTRHVGHRLANALDVLGRDLLMDVAVAVPGDDVLSRLRLHVGRQVLVGDEQDVLRVGSASTIRTAFDEVQQTSRLRLHVGGGVDVGDDCEVRIDLAQLVAPLGQRLAGDRVGERAAGAEVGQEHRLLRVQDLRRLGHEVDAAEDDHVGVDGCRLARQLERVADEVRHLEDLGTLVVVREHHGTTLLLELADLARQSGKLGASRAVITLVAQGAKMLPQFVARRQRQQGSAARPSVSLRSLYAY